MIFFKLAAISKGKQQRKSADFTAKGKKSQRPSTTKKCCFVCKEPKTSLPDITFDLTLTSHTGQLGATCQTLHCFCRHEPLGRPSNRRRSRDKPAGPLAKTGTASNGLSPVREPRPRIRRRPPAGPGTSWRTFHGTFTTAAAPATPTAAAAPEPASASLSPSASAASTTSAAAASAAPAAAASSAATAALAP